MRFCHKEIKRGQLILNYWKIDHLLEQIGCESETMERLVDVVDKLSVKHCAIDKEEFLHLNLADNLCPAVRL